MLNAVPVIVSTDIHQDKILLTLRSDVRREDLCHIEELGGIHEGRPEWCDEQEDEKYGSVLACLVAGPQVGGL